MNRLNQSLKLKILLLSMAALAGIIVVIHGTVYVTTRSVIVGEIKLYAQGIAVAIANNVMGDIQGYKSFNETRDVHSGYYQRMQAVFANIKADSNVKFIYTERRIDAETTEYILDAEPIGTPDHSPPGEIEENTPNKESVFSTGRPTVYSGKYEKWGQLLGAHAPIFDEDGKMLGIVGVDVDVSNIYYCMSRLQKVLFAVYVVIIGITLWMLNKYSDTFLEPLFKDKLTGAYTKRYSETLIQEEIVAAVRSHKNLVLMMLDLDHFKNINDTYGHNFGDKVLSSTSGAIKVSLREKDYFIRYGGEEFIVFISGVTAERALEIAERIRRSVEANEIFNEEKNIVVKMTISIGIANLDLHQNQTAISAQELTDRADKALYVAKENRNCVSVFQDQRQPG